MRVATFLTAIAFLVSAFGSASASDLPPGWELRSPAAGAPPCRAVKLGNAVDTQLLRNVSGQLVLIAGRGDWRLSGLFEQGTLSVDGAPPIAVEGYAIGLIYMVLISDDGLAERVKNAHTLHWNLPWGEFTADVAGLGVAFDAIGVCSR